MKKIFTLCLVAAAAMFANKALAQSDVEMFALVGNSDTKSEIPISIYLTNPTIEVTATDIYLTVNGDKDNFVVDPDDDESYLFETGDRWSLKTHAPVMAAGPKGNDGRNAHQFWVSIASQRLRTFTGTEGVILTLFYDGSELEPGTYEVELGKHTQAITVDETNNVVSYPIGEDKITTFTISEDGKVTAVGGVTVEGAAAAGKDIYTVAGQKVAAPQKGQIYVVDGKVVKY